MKIHHYKSSLGILFEKTAIKQSSYLLGTYNWEV